MPNTVNKILTMFTSLCPDFHISELHLLISGHCEKLAGLVSVTPPPFQFFNARKTLIYLITSGQDHIQKPKAGFHVVYCYY